MLDILDFLCQLLDLFVLIRMGMVSLATTAFAYYCAGWMGVLFHLIVCVSTKLALENLNYIEHYGLLRRHLGDGRYETPAPHHSWNANHLVTNLATFHLQRHSDHHARMNQPWQALVTRDDAPQLPAGYPAMLPLAWVPPLWRRVMDARLDRWQRERAAAESLQPAGQ